MGRRLFAADLFQGAGGASLALKNSGFKVVAAIDFDPRACETYEKNLGLTPICGDIQDYTGLEILDHYGYEVGEVNLVVGCPPCQGFSSLRRTTHPGCEDARKSLVKLFVERVREMEPVAVVFENVPGIIWKNGLPFFMQYLEEMKKMDYMTSWGKLNAADYGVPQIRNRVVAISVKGIDREPGLPPRTHAIYKLAKKEGLEPWLTVRDAIEDLPPLDAGECYSNIVNHVARSHSDWVMNLIKLIPHNGGSRKTLPREYWLDCHKNLEDKGAENIYGRLWWDKPSGTMTCRCTTPSSGRFLHPEQDRSITIREAARLQDFPDRFQFPSANSHSERQVGNAVPIKLMEVIADYVKDYL